MNENLNLVQILKDCPKGTNLYYTVYGEVEFDHIANSSKYPIVLKLKDREWYESFTSEGKLDIEHDGECLLFPSKEQRDWSKFKPTYEFKDGDIVATDDGTWIGITTGGHAHCFIPTYCVLRGNSEVQLYFDIKERWNFSRLATEEEKQKLFKAIKDKGYKWNAETKTLEKLVKPKFDPKTLKPFDKVLIRRSSENYNVWFPDFVSDPPNGTNNKTLCMCVMEDIAMVIPYNDETKHLVGTDDEAPEYYRYWEN